MTALVILGIIFLIIITFFLPRTVASILGGVIVGTPYWSIFIILAIVGLMMDIVALKAMSD